jgi:hypothetical protein
MLCDDPQYARSSANCAVRRTSAGDRVNCIVSVTIIDAAASALICAVVSQLKHLFIMVHLLVERLLISKALYRSCSGGQRRITDSEPE